MKIGPYIIDPPVILAPMAGVTDKPFRRLCKRLNAGLAVSEMTTADPRLWKTEKSLRRMDHEGEPEPISVQIAGYDPQMLADAARFNVDRGAQIIDINMGCPAKKVCNVAAGSGTAARRRARGAHPRRRRARRGRAGDAQDPHRLLARAAQRRRNRAHRGVAGVAALAVHGRTREDHFEGEAEYETIAAVKASVRIPVIANGDISTPERALEIFRRTGCDAVMIGRAAQGHPWIFREIAHYLATGERLPTPGTAEVCDTLLGHLEALHLFYGEDMGVRIARKHLGWYSRAHPGSDEFRATVNRAETASDQVGLTRDYFARLAQH
jgi:tRNA-dihydrouridine synthase B